HRAPHPLGAVPLVPRAVRDDESDPGEACPQFDGLQCRSHSAAAAGAGRRERRDFEAGSQELGPHVLTKEKSPPSGSRGIVSRLPLSCPPGWRIMCLMEAVRLYIRRPDPGWAPIPSIPVDEQ